MMRVVLPYNLEVLDSVIYEYQSFFFPIQYLFIFLSLCVLYFLYWQKNNSGVVISAILGFFWFWSGIVYLGFFYSDINWVGKYVAIIFLAQAVLILWLGVIRKEINFEKKIFAILLALFIAILHPILQLLSGIDYFERFTVGMLPLSTLAFSLAVFISIDTKYKWIILPIPIILTLYILYWNYLIGEFFRLELSILSIIAIGFILRKWNFSSNTHQ